MKFIPLEDWEGLSPGGYTRRQLLGQRGVVEGQLRTLIASLKQAEGGGPGCDYALDEATRSGWEELEDRLSEIDAELETVGGGAETDYLGLEFNPGPLGGNLLTPRVLDLMAHVRAGCSGYFEVLCLDKH